MANRMARALAAGGRGCCGLGRLRLPLRLQSARAIRV